VVGVFVKGKIMKLEIFSKETITRIYNVVAIVCVAVLGIAFVSKDVFAKGGKSSALAVSTGVAFPSQTDAVLLNPAGLAEGAKGNFLGVYMFEQEAPLASIAATFGAAGVGANWVSYNDFGDNFFRFGLGAGLGMMKLGVAAITDDTGSFDADVGAHFDLSKLRLSVVARTLSGGVDRIDVGLGFNSGNARIEFDVKKPSPFDSNVYLFDATLGIQAGKISASIGMDFDYAGSLDNFGVHAGLDWMFTGQLAMNLAYRPSPQEIGGGDEYWAGIRYQF